jgi:hypothetical protein
MKTTSKNQSGIRFAIGTKLPNTIMVNDKGRFEIVYLTTLN